MVNNILFFFLVIPFLVISSCTFSSESNDGDDNLQAKHSDATTIAPKSVQYSLFIDNSLSMMGYFNSKSKFLPTLNKFTTILANKAEDNHNNCPVYFFNNSLTKIDSINQNNLDHVLNVLNNLSSSDSNKNRGYTDLHLVIKDMISTLKDNEVKILVTDGILSPSDISLINTDYFNIIENALYKTVYSKLDSFLFQTTVIQCMSDFTGLYIYMNNKGVKLENAQRPYYIFIFGNARASNELVSTIKNSISTTDLSNIITFNNLNNNTFSSKILLGNNYKFDGSAHNNSIIINKNAYNIHLNLLLNLNDLQLSDSQLVNTNNYTFNFKPENINITPIIDLNNPSNKGFTHKFSFTINNPYYYDSIIISLPYKKPEWCMNCVIENDINLNEEQLEGKTLGYDHIMNGIYSGYKDRNLMNCYFSKTIKFKK